MGGQSEPLSLSIFILDMGLVSLIHFHFSLTISHCCILLKLVEALSAPCWFEFLCHGLLTLCCILSFSGVFQFRCSCVCLVAFPLSSSCIEFSMIICALFLKE